MHPVDGGLQQRVVRAPEYEGVGAKPDDVGEVVAQHSFRAWRVRFARLDDLYEFWASLLIHADHGVDLFDRVQVLLAAHRAFGGDDADAVVPRRLDRRLRSWTDHSDYRELEDLARLVERRCGRGVARDHDQLPAARLQAANDRHRKAPHPVLV